MTNEGQYLSLLDEVIRGGEERGDRTGTGTFSLFGKRLVYDLQESFPLFTTKRVWFRGLAEEMLWFLRGETNIKSLGEGEVGIWDDWAEEDGSLGPVYGKQWREWEDLSIVEETHREAPEVSLDPRKVAGVGTGGELRSESTLHRELYQIWAGMLNRCYNKDRKPHYNKYGGLGVFVCERWHHFPHFFEDVRQFPRWTLRKQFPKVYSLDKDYLACNWYGPASCIWSSTKEQAVNTKRARIFKASHEDGREKLVLRLGRFIQDHDLTQSSVYKVIRGEQSTHKGWTIRETPVKSGYVPRIKIVDQIARLVAGLCENPSSRRHLVSAWNPGEQDEMALPPCHYSFQCYVRDGSHLDLSVSIRSNDLFIGHPFNCAQYALLCHLLSHRCGYEPGLLRFEIGDAHVYSNHQEAVETLLSREPMDSPTLKINSEPKDLWDYTMDDIEVQGYESHPPIQADVAI